METNTIQSKSDYKFEPITPIGKLCIDCGEMYHACTTMIGLHCRCASCSSRIQTEKEKAWRRERRAEAVQDVVEFLDGIYWKTDGATVLDGIKTWEDKRLK